MSGPAAIRIGAGALLLALSIPGRPAAAPSGPPAADARALVDAATGDVEAGRITAQQFLRRCQQAAAVATEDPSVQLCLGTAHLLLGDDPRAEEHLEKARRLDPASKPALFGLATLRERRGDVAGARALYEALVAVEPRDDEERALDAQARAWLAGAPTEDRGFVTAADVSCFMDGTCPPTRQLEIVRIASRSDGACEQRLMLKVPFELDRGTLSGAARKQLDELGRALASGVGGDETLRMVGYASPEGDEAYNLTLSRRRVDAVADYLAERWNISRQRIVTSAVGEAEPVRNRDGSVNLERSRRVELVRGLGAVPCDDGAGP